MSKFSHKGGNERYAACDDARKRPGHAPNPQRDSKGAGILPPPYGVDEGFCAQAQSGHLPQLTTNKNSPRGIAAG